MRQGRFEARFRERWDEFERSLEDLRFAHPGKRSRASAAFPPEEFAARYREVCHHLALARDRRYSRELIDRLNALALAGHQALYGVTDREQNSVLEFLRFGFPRLLRAEGLYLFVAIALFFGPLILFAILAGLIPDAAYYVLSPEQLKSVRAMYGEQTEKLGPRPADSDLRMFAFYIWNNVRIGFQTFAGGILFGLGSIFFLVFNGVVIGTMSGYLTREGLGENFYSFVAGHSAMELAAIAISGAAGLRLAHALLAPGRRSRKAALVEAALPAIRLMYGAAALFVIAAFIEAFWSPHRYLSTEAKIGLGVTLWILLLAYLAFAGRGAVIAARR